MRADVYYPPLFARATIQNIIPRALYYPRSLREFVVESLCRDKIREADTPSYFQAMHEATRLDDIAGFGLYRIDVDRCSIKLAELQCRTMGKEYIGVHYTSRKDIVIKENGRERNGLNVTLNKKEREYEARYRAIRISRTFPYVSYMRNRKRPSVYLSTSQVSTFMDGCRRDFIFVISNGDSLYFANN